MKIREDADRNLRIEIPPARPVDEAEARSVTERTSVLRRLRLSLPRVDRDDAAPRAGRCPPALRALPDGVLITDTSARITDCNSRACEFFGYPCAEIRGRLLTDLLSGADPSLVEALAGALPRAHHAFVSAHGRRKDDSLFPAEMTASALDRDTWCVVVRDITLRRQSEELLRTCYHALNNAGCGIAVLDAAGTLVYANPAAAALWEISSGDEVVGKPLAALWRPSEAIAPLLHALRNGDDGWEGDIEARRSDGEALRIQVAASLDRGAGDEAAGMVVSFMDVTSRQREHEGHLKGEARQAMTASLAAACHHLGQPATVALGNLHLLKLHAGNLSAEGQALLNDVTAAVEKFGDLLRQMNRTAEYKTVDYIGGRPDASAPSNRLLDVNIPEP